MTKNFSDLLQILFRQRAKSPVKRQKTKLLIYDIYLKKYVSADKLLTPSPTKDTLEGVESLKKSQDFMLFDLLLKKLTNPKLDLLSPPGGNIKTKIWRYNSLQGCRYASTIKDFWGKGSGNNSDNFPALPSTSKDEPLVGWAGQALIKPESNPRPEQSAKSPINVLSNSETNSRKPIKGRSTAEKEGRKNYHKNSERDGLLYEGKSEKKKKSLLAKSFKRQKDVALQKKSKSKLWSKKSTLEFDILNKSVNALTKAEPENNIHTYNKKAVIVKPTKKEKGSLFKKICSQMFSFKKFGGKEGEEKSNLEKPGDISKDEQTPTKTSYAENKYSAGKNITSGNLEGNVKESQEVPEIIKSANHEKSVENNSTATSNNLENSLTKSGKENHEVSQKLPNLGFTRSEVKSMALEGKRGKHVTEHKVAHNLSKSQSKTLTINRDSSGYKLSKSYSVENHKKITSEKCRSETFEVNSAGRKSVDNHLEVTQNMISNENGKTDTQSITSGSDLVKEMNISGNVSQNCTSSMRSDNTNNNTDDNLKHFHRTKIETSELIKETDLKNKDLPQASNKGNVNDISTSKNVVSQSSKHEKDDKSKNDTTLKNDKADAEKRSVKITTNDENKTSIIEDRKGFKLLGKQTDDTKKASKISSISTLDTGGKVHSSIKTSKATQIETSLRKPIFDKEGSSYNPDKKLQTQNSTTSSDFVNKLNSSNIKNSEVQNKTVNTITQTPKKDEMRTTITSGFDRPLEDTTDASVCQNNKSITKIEDDKQEVTLNDHSIELKSMEKLHEISAQGKLLEEIALDGDLSQYNIPNYKGFRISSTSETQATKKILLEKSTLEKGLERNSNQPMSKYKTPGKPISLNVDTKLKNNSTYQFTKPVKDENLRKKSAFKEGFGESGGQFKSTDKITKTTASTKSTGLTSNPFNNSTKKVAITDESALTENLVKSGSQAKSLNKTSSASKFQDTTELKNRETQQSKTLVKNANLPEHLTDKYDLMKSSKWSKNTTKSFIKRTPLQNSAELKSAYADITTKRVTKLNLSENSKVNEDLRSSGKSKGTEKNLVKPTAFQNSSESKTTEVHKSAKLVTKINIPERSKVEEDLVKRRSQSESKDKKILETPTILNNTPDVGNNALNDLKKHLKQAKFPEHLAHEELIRDRSQSKYTENLLGKRTSYKNSTESKNNALNGSKKQVNLTKESAFQEDLVKNSTISKTVDKPLEKTNTLQKSTESKNLVLDEHKKEVAPINVSEQLKLNKDLAKEKNYINSSEQTLDSSTKSQKHSKLTNNILHESKKQDAKIKLTEGNALKEGFVKTSTVSTIMEKPLEKIAALEKSTESKNIVFDDNKKEVAQTNISKQVMLNENLVEVKNKTNSTEQTLNTPTAPQKYAKPINNILHEPKEQDANTKLTEDNALKEGFVKTSTVSKMMDEPLKKITTLEKSTESKNIVLDDHEKQVVKTNTSEQLMLNKDLVKETNKINSTEQTLDIPTAPRKYAKSANKILHESTKQETKTTFSEKKAYNEGFNKNDNESKTKSKSSDETTTLKTLNILTESALEDIKIKIKKDKPLTEMTFSGEKHKKVDDKKNIFSTENNTNEEMVVNIVPSNKNIERLKIRQEVNYHNQKNKDETRTVVGQDKFQSSTLKDSKINDETSTISLPSASIERNMSVKKDKLVNGIRQRNKKRKLLNQIMFNYSKKKQSKFKNQKQIKELKTIDHRKIKQLTNLKSENEQFRTRSKPNEKIKNLYKTSQLKGKPLLSRQRGQSDLALIEKNSNPFTKEKNKKHIIKSKSEQNVNHLKSTNKDKPEKQTKVTRKYTQDQSSKEPLSEVSYSLKQRAKFSPKLLKSKSKNKSLPSLERINLKVKNNTREGDIASKTSLPSVNTSNVKKTPKTSISQKRVDLLENYKRPPNKRSPIAKETVPLKFSKKFERTKSSPELSIKIEEKQTKKEKHAEAESDSERAKQLSIPRIKHGSSVNLNLEKNNERIRKDQEHFEKSLKVSKGKSVSLNRPVGSAGKSNRSDKVLSGKLAQKQNIFSISEDLASKTTNEILNPKNKTVPYMKNNSLKDEVKYEDTIKEREKELLASKIHKQDSSRLPKKKNPQLNLTENLTKKKNSREGIKINNSKSKYLLVNEQQKIANYHNKNKNVFSSSKVTTNNISDLSMSNNRKSSGISKTVKHEKRSDKPETGRKLQNTSKSNTSPNRSKNKVRINLNKISTKEVTTKEQKIVTRITNNKGDKDNKNSLSDGSFILTNKKIEGKTEKNYKNVSGGENPIKKTERPESFYMSRVSRSKDQTSENENEVTILFSRQKAINTLEIPKIQQSNEEENRPRTQPGGTEQSVKNSKVPNKDLSSSRKTVDGLNSANQPVKSQKSNNSEQNNSENIEEQINSTKQIIKETYNKAVDGRNKPKVLNYSTQTLNTPKSIIKDSNNGSVLSKEQMILQKTLGTKNNEIKHDFIPSNKINLEDSLNFKFTNKIQPLKKLSGKDSPEINMSKNEETLKNKPQLLQVLKKPAIKPDNSRTEFPYDTKSNLGNISTIESYNSMSIRGENNISKDTPKIDKKLPNYSNEIKHNQYNKTNIATLRKENERSKSTLIKDKKVDDVARKSSSLSKSALSTKTSFNKNKLSLPKSDHILEGKNIPLHERKFKETLLSKEKIADKQQVTKEKQDQHLNQMDQTVGYKIGMTQNSTAIDNTTDIVKKDENKMDQNSSLETRESQFEIDGHSPEKLRLMLGNVKTEHNRKAQNKQVPEIRKEEIKENTFVKVQHGKKQEDNKKHKFTSLQDNQNKGINNTAYLTKENESGNDFRLKKLSNEYFLQKNEETCNNVIKQDENFQTMPAGEEGIAIKEDLSNNTKGENMNFIKVKTEINSSSPDNLFNLINENVIKTNNKVDKADIKFKNNDKNAKLTSKSIDKRQLRDGQNTKGPLANVNKNTDKPKNNK